MNPLLSGPFTFISPGDAKALRGTTVWRREEVNLFQANKLGEWSRSRQIALVRAEPRGLGTYGEAQRFATFVLTEFS